MSDDDVPLLEVTECSPFGGGIIDPFFVREDVKPTLW